MKPIVKDSSGIAFVQILLLVLMAGILVKSIESARYYLTLEKIEQTRTAHDLIENYFDQLRSYLIQNPDVLPPVLQGQYAQGYAKFAIPSLPVGLLPSTNFGDGVSWGQGISLSGVTFKVTSNDVGMPGTRYVTMSFGVQLDPQKYLGRTTKVYDLHMVARLSEDPSGTSEPVFTEHLAVLGSGRDLNIVWGMEPSYQNHMLQLAVSFMSACQNVEKRLRGSSAINFRCDPLAPGTYFPAARVRELYPVNSFGKRYFPAAAPLPRPWRGKVKSL